MWKPVTLKDLDLKIEKAVSKLDAEVLRHWQNIKVIPEKWQEQEYGNEGGGFWVVAIFGKSVIWYNDIEEGFNISAYSEYGKIDEYYCNQDDLKWVLERMLN